MTDIAFEKILFPYLPMTVLDVELRYSVVPNVAEDEATVRYCRPATAPEYVKVIPYVYAFVVNLFVVVTTLLQPPSYSWIAKLINPKELHFS